MLRASELLIVVACYSVAFILMAFIVHYSSLHDAGLAAGLSAIVGVQAAAFLYGKRKIGLAPVGVKATLGIVLAVLCILYGLAFHLIWRWMHYPDVELTIHAIGTIVCSLVLFSTFQSAFSRPSSTNKDTSK